MNTELLMGEELTQMTKINIKKLKAQFNRDIGDIRESMDMPLTEDEQDFYLSEIDAIIEDINTINKYLNKQL